jgi:hypothetical protein
MKSPAIKPRSSSFSYIERYVIVTQWYVLPSAYIRYSHAGGKFKRSYTEYPSVRLPARNMMFSSSYSRCASNHEDRWSSRIYYHHHHHSAILWSVKWQTWVLFLAGILILFSSSRSPEWLLDELSLLSNTCQLDGKGCRILKLKAHLYLE